MTRGRSNYFVLLIVMMCAFEVILAFVPALGYIDFGGYFYVSTLFLPVVAAAILLGSGAGAFVGLLQGLCRFVGMTFLVGDKLYSPFFTPFASAEAIPQSFWSLAITLLAPVLAGFLVGALSDKLGRVFRSSALFLGIAGAFGGLANWVFTYAGIFAVFGGVLPSAFGVPLADIVKSALTIGALIETTASALVCAIPGAFLYKKYISRG